MKNDIMIMNDGLGRMLEKAITICFKV